MLPRAGLRRRLLALNAATAATTGAPSLLPSRYLSPCLLLHPRRRQLSTKDDDDRGESRVRELLKQVQLGQLPVEAAVRAITAAAAQQAAKRGYDAVDGYAKIDYAREARTGLPEVIYGEGKTPAQLLAILRSMGGRRRQQQQSDKQSHSHAAAGVIVASRVSVEKHAELQKLIGADPEAAGALEAYGHLEYLPTPRLLILRAHPEQEAPLHPDIGTITVLCAGTADLSVAEEAAVVAELCGAKVQRLYDVGIAGIHRLFSAIDTIRQSHACVAVAGMDGALPTVVAGLMQSPVIAVPTSVGYGVGANGIAPLMTMLNACAPGVAVVNIDNGLGAAAMAIKILRGRLREP